MSPHLRRRFMARGPVDLAHRVAPKAGDPGQATAPPHSSVTTTCGGRVTLRTLGFEPLPLGFAGGPSQRAFLAHPSMLSRSSNTFGCCRPSRVRNDGGRAVCVGDQHDVLLPVTAGVLGDGSQLGLPQLRVRCRLEDGVDVGAARPGRRLPVRGVHEVDRRRPDAARTPEDHADRLRVRRPGRREPRWTRSPCHRGAPADGLESSEPQAVVTRSSMRVRARPATDAGGAEGGLAGLAWMARCVSS